MSETNCNACNSLKRTSSEFVLNGVTDTIAASLKNNTGFNPSLTALHTNCEDLNDANDCLIARMDSEVESYEVCDWKEFMHKFLPNNYELLKAIIAGDCGQWERINGLCSLIEQLVSPTFDELGIRIGTSYPSRPELTGGEVVDNNIINDSVGEWDGVGFHYVKRQVIDCSGSSRIYEWFYPWIRGYRFADDLPYGTTFWRVPISRAAEWGMSGLLIQWLSLGLQWRQGYGNAGGLQMSATIATTVEDSYLVLKYFGSTGSMNGIVIDQEIRDPWVVIS